MREDRGYDPDIGRVENARLHEIIVKLIQSRSGYREGGEGKSWKDWILGIVALILVAALGTMVSQNSDMKSDIKASTATQTAIFQRLDSQDRRLDRLENRGISP